MTTPAQSYRLLHHLSLSLLLLAHPPAHAADAETGQPQRRVGAILKDIKKSESSVNALFNQLNSSDDFDLVCYAFEQTGSKTRQRICEPLFMKKARNAEAQRFISGTREGTDRTVSQGDSALQPLIQEQMLELRAELQAAANGSAEFAALIQQLQALVNEYALHPKARDNDPALGFLARYLQRDVAN